MSIDIILAEMVPRKKPEEPAFPEIEERRLPTMPKREFPKREFPTAPDRTPQRPKGPDYEGETLEYNSR